MANVKPRNMAAIASGKFTGKQLHEALMDLQNATNNIGQQTNAAPVGVTPPPQPHSALSVVGGGGIIDVAVTDNSPQYAGNEHFFDYSTDNFNTFHTKSMGPAKNWRGNLGKAVFQVRSYTSYPTSAPSTMLYHPDVDTSTGSEPALQAGQGSGTGDAGYGNVPYNATVPPIRK